MSDEAAHELAEAIKKAGEDIRYGLVHLKTRLD